MARQYDWEAYLTGDESVELGRLDDQYDVFKSSVAGVQTKRREIRRRATQRAKSAHFRELRLKEKGETNV